MPLLPTTGGGVADADFACVSGDSYTYTDPKFVTMIVSGAPGDVERNDACPGDPSLKQYSIRCSPDYGYGRLAVENATHATWTFEARQTPIGGSGGGVGEAPITYTDRVTIVKTAAGAQRRAA